MINDSAPMLGGCLESTGTEVVTAVRPEIVSRLLTLVEGSALCGTPRTRLPSR